MAEADAQKRARFQRAPRSKRQAVGREDSRRGNAPAAHSGLEQVRSGIDNAPAKIEVNGRPFKRGRPREQHGSVVLSLRLPGDLVDAIDREVAQSGQYRDRSEFIRQKVAAALPDPTSANLGHRSGGRQRANNPDIHTIHLDDEMERAIGADPKGFAMAVLEVLRGVKTK